MNLEDQVPILVLDVLEADVSQDTSVVYEDIDTAKGLDCGVDDLVAVLYRVVVCDGLSAGLLYLIDDYIGGLARAKVSYVRETTPAGPAPASSEGMDMVAWFSLLRSFLHP